MERKSISKKTRFEVYKRDKFTCQYCGRKAPDVILEIDHIEPVAKGGGNNILNLITNCKDCNSGKRDIPLDTNDILEKQRKQLEDLEERREQIEMLFDWKKSLDNLKDYSGNLLVEYIESKIAPYTFKDNGKKKIIELTMKFEINDIFEAIDKSQKTYLKTDSKGELIKASVEDFINKIGGILVNSKRTPLDLKIHYIKGICRNRFSYWDDRKGIIILKSYVKALQDYGWSTDDIIKDLDTEASNLAKEATNWTEWKGKMEKWIEDIKCWKKDDEIETSSGDLEISELEQISLHMSSNIQSFLELIKYLSKPFGEIDETKFIHHYISGIQEYVQSQVQALCEGNDKIEELTPNMAICKKYHLLSFINVIDNSLKYEIENMFSCYVTEWTLSTLYLPAHEISSSKDSTVFMHYFQSDIQKLIDSQ